MTKRLTSNGWRSRRPDVTFRFNDLLIRTSRSPWRFALIAVLNAAAFAALFALEDRFEVITGVPVFDTQNGLTPAALVKQLPLYQGEALTAYLQRRIKRPLVGS